MKCRKQIGLIAVLVGSLLIGCSKTDAPNGATLTAGTTAAATTVPAIPEAGPNSRPIAAAAYDFVDAVVKGDTQRASARLTPQAMQRIIANKEQFAPTGLSTASFKLGEIRNPTPDQAIVQCVLTDSSQGAPLSEEMCCVMRKVENEWRVAGIAYGTSPDKPWVLSDFESGKSFPIPRQSMGSSVTGAHGDGQQSTTATTQPRSLQPPTSQEAAGMPPVAAPQNPAVAGPGPAGLGMPAVAPSTAAPNNFDRYAPQAPYTAQEPPIQERR